jgi:glycosyltransferase involved in cell wall biosynthesis
VSAVWSYAGNMGMYLPRISAAMIVRNEAAVLVDCLRSIRDEVDEIVITDTGSSDRTCDIASTFGARVLYRPWDDDFAAARNHSLDAATGDWILYIDADERLEVARRGELKRVAAANPGSAAILVHFQPRTGFTTYLEARLFRRDQRLRFVGRIHERIWPHVQVLCAEESLNVARCAARLTHVGYDGEQSHKHRRNLPLLERAVIEDPERVYCWWHLGETLAALGRRTEAETALRTAIRIARRSQLPRDCIDASLAYQTLTRLGFDAGEDPLPIIEDGLASFPQDQALIFMKARALVNRKEYQLAIEVLESLTREKSASISDSYVAYDRRIFGEFAMDLAGVALFRLGRFAEAKAAFEGAANAASVEDRRQYRMKASAMSTKLARAC